MGRAKFALCPKKVLYRFNPVQVTVPLTDHKCRVFTHFNFDR